MPVAVLDDYQRIAHEYADWGSLGETVAFVHEHLEGDALVDRVAGADVVVAMRERTAFDAETLRALPNLRLLVTTGMANASIDLDAARAQGVTVCGTGGLPGSAAELTWALILAVMRHVPQADAAMRDGRWQETIGTDLADHTLGVVGLGRLGRRVARVAQAFDMRVQAWSQHLDPEAARALGVEPVEKRELLATSDIVSLHLKLSDRTRGVIGADDLALMRRGATLINTSRGPLVDERALIEALEQRRIAAGIDVFDVEPLPTDHPLRGLPNVVLTPHLGYVTRGTFEHHYPDAVEDIVAWRAGKPVRVIS